MSSIPLSLAVIRAIPFPVTKEVDKQASLIKQRLERHQSSLPTLIIETLN